MRHALGASIFACAAMHAQAEAWLMPGDAGLRSDIQLLADSGVLRGPVTTWPISWPDVARDALAADGRGLNEAAVMALLRVQRAARAAAYQGYGGSKIRVSGQSEPSTLRPFADSPREEAEIAVSAKWLSDHFAINLQGAYVANPDDRKQFRPDGSYVGLNVGNFMVSAGFMERWWGPGWDGSLILSTNARPISTLTLERNYTDPFKSKLLSWIGSWRASIAIGALESEGVPVTDVRFLAARVNFKPRPWMEFGLTRTAQFCGGGRPCDLNAFTDLLIGNDNQVAEDGSTDDQPGNQLAGYDMRLRSPWLRLPLAFYMQWIGEDEAGGFPSKFMGLFGLETWGSSRFGGWRTRAEYADTTCDFMADSPEFGCAYRNSLYPQGYGYRGRIIGHALDNDSHMLTLGGLLTRPKGDVLDLTLRWARINRDGGTHAISDVPLDLFNVELRYSQVVPVGKVTVGAGYDDGRRPADSSAVVRGFVMWEQAF